MERIRSHIRTPWGDVRVQDATFANSAAVRGSVYEEMHRKEILEAAVEVRAGWRGKLPGATPAAPATPAAGGQTGTPSGPPATPTTP